MTEALQRRQWQQKYPVSQENLSQADLGISSLPLARKSDSIEGFGGSGLETGIRLFIGGHAGKIQGEREDLVGDRMFSSVYGPYPTRFDCSRLTGLLDSGAFSDPWVKRLSPEQALERQLTWEKKASELWQQSWQAYGLVSYDLLIDEIWIGTERHKQRWTVKEAERAVAVTVEAARYLASQRERLTPRKLVLSCQGVDGIQYKECVSEVLKVAQPQDWIGLGGFCILGRQTSWLPEFWVTCYEVLPLIAAAGVKHCHIFGVLYLPALGGLLWLADRYGLRISTDSTRPILQVTWQGKENRKKANIQFPYWRDNVNHWKETLLNLRTSKWYREPPLKRATRQLQLNLEIQCEPTPSSVASQGLGGCANWESKPLVCPGTSKSPNLLKSQLTVSESCNNDSQIFQSTMISVPSTQNQNNLMSSWADSPARTCPWPENGRESSPKPVPGSFSNSCESFAWYDQSTSSWRTFQACLLEGWELYSRSFPKRGTMRNGTLYQRHKWELSTDESECLLLPTPAVKEPGWRNLYPVTKAGNIPEHPNQRWYDKTTGRLLQKGLVQAVTYLPTPCASDATTGAILGKNDSFSTTKNGALRRHIQTGSNFSLGLSRLVQILEPQEIVQNLPTPKAQDGQHPGVKSCKPGQTLHLSAAVQNLPTPLARDWKGNSGKAFYNRGGNRNLPTKLQTGRKLNPNFVEAMMGFPQNWTVLEENSCDTPI